MKYSLGKPKLLIQADDFYDFMSQEASAFFAFINAFTIFLRRLIMLTSLSPVSYTHLDVYKRQFIKRIINAMKSITSAIDVALA